MGQTIDASDIDKTRSSWEGDLSTNFFNQADIYSVEQALNADNLKDFRRKCS